MQFTQALLAAAAVAVASAASFGMTGAQFVGVTAGSAFNISWYGASGPVTLILKNGEANALKTVSTIASGLTGTTYGWIIPSTLPVDYYALEIDDSGAPNYSQRFLISGGPALSSSGSSSVTSATASTSTSASSGSSVTTSASSSATTAAGSNSTTTGSTTTGSKTSSSSASKTSSTSSSSSTVPATNSAASIASPLAFILLAVAALMTLN